jgi:hypothetical protein
VRSLPKCTDGSPPDGLESVGASSYPGVMVDEVGSPMFMLETAILGFHQARVRFLRHGAEAVAESVFVPLSEAMWWAVSVHEGFIEVGGQDYRRMRDEFGGRVLRGAKFARNRLGHQRALAVERVDGIILPAAPPFRMFEFVWRPAAELPPPDRLIPTELACYENYLAGKPARQTLDSCAAWLEHCRNALSSTLGISWPGAGSA